MYERFRIEYFTVVHNILAESRRNTDRVIRPKYHSNRCHVVGEVPDVRLHSRLDE